MKKTKRRKEWEERVSVERQKKKPKKNSNLLSREGAGGKNSALAPGGSTVPTEGD
jgi:hypothetical protein